LQFYNSLVKLMSELRDQIKQWHQSRQMDIAELSQQRKTSSLSNTSSPVRPIASPAKRTTRSQARKSAAPAAAESSAQPPSAPQWGAWKGGDIRFDD